EPERFAVEPGEILSVAVLAPLCDAVAALRGAGLATLDVEATTRWVASERPRREAQGLARGAAESRTVAVLSGFDRAVATRRARARVDRAVFTHQFATGEAVLATRRARGEHGPVALFAIIEASVAARDAAGRVELALRIAPELSACVTECIAGGAL